MMSQPLLPFDAEGVPRSLLASSIVVEKRPGPSTFPDLGAQDLERENLGASAEFES